MRGRHFAIAAKPIISSGMLAAICLLIAPTSRAQNNSSLQIMMSRARVQIFQVTLNKTNQEWTYILGHSGWDLELDFLNNGASPALEVAGWAEVKGNPNFSESQQELARDCPQETKGTELQFTQMIGGGQHFTPILHGEYNPQDATATLARYVVGHLDYKDIFSPNIPAHHLDWCAVAIPFLNEPVPWIVQLVKASGD